MSDDEYNSDDVQLDGQLDASAKEQKSEPDPVLLHDGIGLTLDEVRNLLMQKNDSVVGKDDPILMLVTINNAFLNVYGSMLEKHNKAITAIMQKKTEEYVKAVKGSTEALAEELSSASVDTIQKVFNQHALSLNNFSHNMKWTAAIITISALVNVIIFAFGAIK